MVLDTDHGCEFLDAETQLDRYRSALDRKQSRALSPAKSHNLIHQIAQEI
ncbi:Scr1 family TA system antitoxin-like transcriptional regulator [Streptomyces chengmaiensis]|nr:Scr1 family TA system antitoxin-like transcriptional regulator [Streptomyces chengmaiensis]